MLGEGLITVKFQPLLDSIQEAAKRHEDHFPRGMPLLMQVLKGHLLVEELVRSTLASHLRCPEALIGPKGASLSCHQAICLTEALLRDEAIEAWTWDAMRKLNALRNRLAHKLTGVDLEREIEEFTAFVLSHKPDLPAAASKDFTNSRSTFEICVLELTAMISAIDFYGKALAENIDHPIPT